MVEDIFVTPFGECRVSELPEGIRNVDLPKRKDGLPDRRFAIVQDWEWAVDSFVANRWAKYAS